MLALIGASGVFLVSGGNGKDGQPVRSSPAGASKPVGSVGEAGRTCDDPIYRLLCEFYGVASYAGAYERFTQHPAEQALTVPDGGVVLIATVPDPQDSHVGYSFDESLDAIRLGMSRAGYQSDRFFLPWTSGPREREETQELSAGPAVGNDPKPDGRRVFRETQKQLPLKRFGREQPGGLLFRQPDGPPVLILLVGETPTYGVQTVALASAVEHAKVLAPSSGVTSCSPNAVQCSDNSRVMPWHANAAQGIDVFLLGPSFSGSAESIRRVLDESFVSARIISGAASAPLVAKTLGHPGSHGEGRSYSATTRDDDDIDEAVTHHVLTEVGEKRAVFLRESDTSYGQGFRKPKKDAGSKEEGEPSREYGDTILYPVHISNLAEAFAQRGLFGSNSVPRLRSQEGRALPLSFEISGAPLDVPPMLFPEKSSREVGLALAAVLDSIRREGVSLVGIAGTNAYDKLFLARMVRQHAPNVQLLIYDSDALLTHPSHLADLHGAWIVSSYPNVPSLQRWAPQRRAPERNRRRLYFTGSRTEGLYNATLALLSDRLNKPALSRKMVDYWHLEGNGAAQVMVGSPAVWLTAVGRSELWPIKQLPLKSFEKEALWRPRGTTSPIQVPPLAVPYPTIEPAAFFIALSALSLLAGIWSLAYFRLLTSHGFRTLEWLVGEVPSAGSRLRLPLAIVFFASILGGLSFVLYRGSVQSLINLPHSARAMPALLVASSAVLVLSIVCLDLIGRVPLPPVAKIATGVGVAMICIFVCGQMGPLTLEDVWHYERSVILSSGLSPLVPGAFFSMAVALVAHGGGRALRILPYWRNVAGFAPQESAQERLVKNVQSSLKPQPRRQSFLSAFVAAVALAFLCLDPLLTLESKPFNFAISAGVVVLPAVLAEIAIYALGVWRALRRVLDAFSASPLAEAFDRLPPERGRNIGMLLSSSPADAVQTEHSLDQWRWFAMSDDEVAAVRRHYEDEVRVGRLVYGYELSTQRELATVASDVLDELQRVRVLGVGESSASEDSEKRASDPALLPQKRDDGTSLDALGSSRRVLTQDTFLLRVKEDFAAEQVVQFIAYVFAHIRNALATSVYASILLVLALSSYPFQPQQLLLRICLAVLFGAIAIVSWIIVSAERNELLSRVANRTPNKVDLDGALFSQLATYILLPLAAVLATQFPGLSHLLGDLLSMVSGG